MFRFGSLTRRETKILAAMVHLGYGNVVLESRSFASAQACVTQNVGHHELMAVAKTFASGEARRIARQYTET